MSRVLCCANALKQLLNPVLASQWADIVTEWKEAAFEQCGLQEGTHISGVTERLANCSHKYLFTAQRVIDKCSSEDSQVIINLV
jgi:hypothetical protein